MTRQEIAAEIRKTYGNMLNVQQLAEVFSCNRNTVTKYVNGVPYFKTGKEKKYLATDIARRIDSMMEVDA